jgi:hypothetical protein
MISMLAEVLLAAHHSGFVSAHSDNRSFNTVILYFIKMLCKSISLVASDRDAAGDGDKRQD